MKIIVLVFLVYIAFFSRITYAETCPNGEKRLSLNEACIPERLFNYLYCLKRSGDGRVEIKKVNDTNSDKKLEINIGGKGSGVVIKAQATGGFRTQDSERAIREISERLDPSLAANCRELAASDPYSPNPAGVTQAHSASTIPLAGIGQSVDSVVGSIQNVAYGRNNDNTLNISYNESYAGKTFSVVQDITSQRKTGRALLEDSIYYSIHNSSRDGNTSQGSSKEKVNDACSDDSRSHFIAAISNLLGAPSEISPTKSVSKDELPCMNLDFCYGRSITSTNDSRWDFSDHSAVQLRYLKFEWNGGERKFSPHNDYNASNYDAEKSTCSIKICVIPPNGTQCFDL